MRDERVDDLVFYGDWSSYRMRGCHAMGTIDFPQASHRNAFNALGTCTRSLSRACEEGPADDGSARVLP